MKFDQTLMSFVSADLKTGGVPMLVGEPGIGKSSWVKALAKQMHTRCFTVACNQMADKADLTGARLVPTDDKKSYQQMFFPHATMCAAIQYAKDNPRENPILFLDEINRTNADVTSATLSISTERAIGTSELPENLRIVTAGNDHGNIVSLDSASISRFVLYPVEPDIGTFLNLDPDLNVFIKNVLKAHPETLFCKPVAVVAKDSNKDDDDDANVEEIIDDSEEMEQFTTPRTISGLSRWLNTFTSQELTQFLGLQTVVDGEEMSILQAGIQSHTGHTNFTLYLTNEIAQNVMTVANTTSGITVGKPAIYDSLKGYATRQDLTDAIANMGDNDKSGCIVFALYDKTDNSNVITELAKNTSSLQPEDMRTLMLLASNQKLDNDNVQAMLNTDCPLSKTLAIILQQA